ncbi:HNH endonuclease [Methylobacterium fujisawaense]
MAEMTRERLLEMLRFEPETGRFFWIKPPRCHPEVNGKEAGYAQRGTNGKDYWHIKIDGGKYKRSHLVFLLRNGRFPFPCADHRDGNSLNDRPDNIREATIHQNNMNHQKRAKRSPLPMGVRKLGSRFQARLAHNGRTNYLGTFATADEARAVYLLKRKECFGEFA